MILHGHKHTKTRTWVSLALMARVSVCSASLMSHAAPKSWVCPSWSAPTASTTGGHTDVGGEHQRKRCVDGTDQHARTCTHMHARTRAYTCEHVVHTSRGVITYPSLAQPHLATWCRSRLKTPLKRGGEGTWCAVKGTCTWRETGGRGEAGDSKESTQGHEPNAILPYLCSAWPSRQHA